jgi:hypothetical protein
MKSSTSKRAALTAAVLALAVLLLGWLITRGKPPEMGGDAEVARAVDALFTALTARDEKLLGQCEQRLHALGDGGKLPADASAYLDGLIDRARKGRWESAAEQLYAFMKAQRPKP